MVIPRKHLHEPKTSRRIVRRGWRLNRFWVVKCKSCSMKHIFNDEKTARFAANFIEDTQASRKVMLLSNGS